MVDSIKNILEYLEQTISENVISEKYTLNGDDSKEDYKVMVAKAYERAPSFEQSATKHWDALLTSSQNFYRKMLSDIQVIYTEKEMYADAQEMKMDVKKNKRMYVSLEYTGHPYWNDTQYQTFRAVHDYIVHVEGGSDFSLQGELRATNLHMHLVPELARPAVFNEIAGKVCYYLTYGHFPPSKICVLQGFDFNNIGQLKDTPQRDTHKPYVLHNDEDQLATQDYDPGEVPQGYDAKTNTIKKSTVNSTELEPETAMESKNNKTNKSKLNETSFAIPTPTFITNYEETDIVKVVKELFKDYDGYKLKKIQAVGDTQFYNLEISADLDDDFTDLELKRFALSQKIHKFRAELFMDLSAILPVINVNLAKFNFSKGMESIDFCLTLLLSATNQREWVSGEYKQRDKKLGDKIMASIEKRDLSEKKSLNDKLNFLLENGLH